MTGSDPSTVTVHASYRPVGKIVLRDIGGDPLLVPVSGEAARKQYVYPLNKTGAFIWKMLAEEGAAPSLIVDALCRTFSTDQSEAERDCLEFLGLLLEEGLVERVQE